MGTRLVSNSGADRRKAPGLSAARTASTTCQAPAVVVRPGAPSLPTLPHPDSPQLQQLCGCRTPTCVCDAEEQVLDDGPRARRHRQVGRVHGDALGVGGGPREICFLLYILSRQVSISPRSGSQNRHMAG